MTLEKISLEKLQLLKMEIDLLDKMIDSDGDSEETVLRRDGLFTQFFEGSNALKEAWSNI
jgi:hypothetical protein